MDKWDIIATVTNDLSQDQRMHRICDSLSQHGYKVMLIGTEQPGSIELTEFPFQTLRIKCFFASGVFFYTEYNLRLFLFLLKHKPRIVNAVDLDTILAASLVSVLTQSKVVFDAHEWYEGSPELLGRPIIKSIWKIIARLTLPFIKNNYTVSASVAQKYSKKYKQSYQLVRNFPKEKSPCTTIKSSKIILYQGVLNKGRGLEQIIHLIGNDKKYDLKIIGEGDLSEKLRMLVKQNKYKNIEFLGFISPDKLHDLTSKAAIGLNLLDVKSPNYYYSLANKFLDYVQAEVPSISMNFPEYCAMNKIYEVSCLIDKLEADTMMSAIDQLMNNQQYYSLLRSNCLKAKQVWCWSNEEHTLLNIYQKLLPKT